MTSDESFRVHIVPHTHWDREWYAPFQVFRAQLIDLWDQLLALTEQDADFRFLMDGQTVVVDDYLAIRPEARPRVERAIRSGQIQVGPWYTLPDEFLVSGEALVRDLQRGIADGDTHGGALRVGYLPDSFGHTAQMPQIYRQFDFHHALVWRGVPSAIDRLAFDWEAPDGSRILTAYMGTSYSHGVDLPVDGPGLAARLRMAVRALEPFRPGREILLMNGNDHVLPQAGLTGAARSASLLLGWDARLARLDDYLEALPESGWPRWRGELRASSRANVLMGTLSARIPDKQAYFAAGLALERLAEPMSALSGLDANGLLAEAWTLLLQNAAHDTACGSGIDAVADEARQRSEAAGQIAREVARRAAARLRAQSAGGAGPAAEASLLVWNPSPFERNEPVEIALPVVPPGAQDLGSIEPAPASTARRFPAEELFRLLSMLDEGRLTGQPVRALRFDRQGETVRLVVETDPLGTSQDLEAARRSVEQLATTPGVEAFEVRVREAPRHQALLLSGPLAGCGSGRVSLAAGTAIPGEAAVRATGVSLGNDRIRCELRSDGTVAVHHLLTDTRYAGLLRLVDQGDAGDEYNFSPAGEAVTLQPEAGTEVRILEAGPLRGTIEQRARYQIPAGLGPDRGRRRADQVALPVRLRLSLTTGGSRLDGELEFDHHALDHRLRLECPLPFHADHSQADGAFHVIGRRAVSPVQEAGAPEWELPTYPMRTFVDVSDGRRGLTLITHGLHEYELIPGPPPRLALTIVRAVGWLSRDDLRYRVGHAGPPLETPGAQVPGRHRVGFSLAFHAGDWETGGAWHEAERALIPLQVLGIEPAGIGVAGGGSSIVLEPDAVQMTACVPRQDGYDLRLVNASPRPAHARLALTPTPAAIAPVTLGGRLGDRLALEAGTVRLPLRPWEIATLRVWRAAGV